MINSRTIAGPGFKIRYDKAHGYLRAHVFDGKDSQAVSMAMWKMLGAECQALGIKRLLVLEELEDIVDPVDIDAINQAMLEAGFQTIRLAFVELLDGVALNEYGEILCRELGMTLRVFTNEDTARRWLLYGE